MNKELIVKGATIEEAVQKAATELGIGEDNFTYEIIETPKKTLFGKTKGEAVIKVIAELGGNNSAVQGANGRSAAAGSSVDASAQKLALAKEYLQTILSNMGLSQVKLVCEEKEDGAIISFDGEGIAVLIGHHGETLDALQYLVALTCNRIDGDYYRITLDCGKYREKREATLQALAQRIAHKVKKTGRSQLLEPMNPYERRIIHAVVSEIGGVSSKSKGEEPNRRVVITSDTPARSHSGPRAGGGQGGGQRRDDFKKKPYVHKPERTMEEILKNDFKDKEASAELYSKIEF